MPIRFTYRHKGTIIFCCVVVVVVVVLISPWIFRQLPQVHGIDLAGIKLAPPEPPYKKAIEGEKVPEYGKLSVGKDSVVMGNISGKIGDGSVVIGATDNHGNTVLNQSMALGRNAHAGPQSIAIGANANAGVQVREINSVVSYGGNGNTNIAKVEVNNFGQTQRHISDFPSEAVDLLNQYILKYREILIPIWVWNDAESIHLGHELEEYAVSKGGKAQIAGWIYAPPPATDLNLDPDAPKITIGPHH